MAIGDKTEKTGADEPGKGRYAIVLAALLVSFLPLLLIMKMIPEEAKPFSLSRDSLFLAGEKIYYTEGCNVCHTRRLRKSLAESLRFNPNRFLANAEGYVEQRGAAPAIFGYRRIGPDLRVPGGRYESFEYYSAYIRNPRIIYPASIMPSYDYLFQTPIDVATIWEVIEMNMRRTGIRQNLSEGAKKELMLRLQSRSKGDALIAFLFTETGK